METTAIKKSTIWSTGLAMFAMFFGAGNIVFPLALGQMTQGNNFFAILGMVLTGILVPLCGLLAMMLFNGDYRSFFFRIGKIPGFALILLILGLIGPFAGIPRCITISYSTLSAFGLSQVPGVNLVTFSLFVCFVIFLFTYRPNRVVSLIGNVLTPILLASLVVIFFKGILSMPHMGSKTLTPWTAFSEGAVGGYHMLDLLAAFFFSPVVLLCLQKGAGPSAGVEGNRRLLSIAVAGSFIAAALLTTVYISFIFLASGYSGVLKDVPGHELLGTLARELLGPYAGLAAGVTVAFATLTTEIALAAIFSQFLQRNLFRDKIPYPATLAFTLFIAFLVSTLNFSGITAYLGPILHLCYPALIVLSVVNLLHKLYDFKPVKSLVYSTFAVSALIYFLR